MKKNQDDLLDEQWLQMLTPSKEKSADTPSEFALIKDGLKRRADEIDLRVPHADETLLSGLLTQLSASNDRVKTLEKNQDLRKLHPQTAANAPRWRAVATIAALGCLLVILGPVLWKSEENQLPRGSDEASHMRSIQPAKKAEELQRALALLNIESSVQIKKDGTAVLRFEATLDAIEAAEKLGLNTTKIADKLEVSIHPANNTVQP